jgi:glycosyltransferase involved in cell wall biosynthesis
LGFVPEADKFDALEAAAAVITPSKVESLSMLALEAWLMGKPVVANGRCAVLKQQCRDSNGGLYYTTFEEFAGIMERLLPDARLREELGANGRAFARRNYDWDVVVAKYQSLFSALSV